MLKPAAGLVALIALVIVAGCGGGGTAANAGRSPAASGTTGAAGLATSLVVIGDSLPYGREDCGGCRSFPTLYGEAIAASHGPATDVQNLSTHDGAAAADLLRRLRTDDSVRRAVGAADVVVVSIGHNDTPWNRNDDTCDGPSGDVIDWSRFTPACAQAEAKTFGVTLDDVLKEVQAIRAGRPTAVRVINFYNDWIGGPGAPAAATAGSRLVLDAFSRVICDAAAAHGATCVDTYHAFNGPNGLRPAGALLARDYTHPSADGHRRIAELLTASGLAPLR